MRSLRSATFWCHFPEFLAQFRPNYLARMKIYAIAAIPGDGIGKEVIAAGMEILNACAATDGSFSIASKTFDWGSDHYKQHGVMIPESGLEQLRPFDAI